jgi:hypothetical protein
VSLISWSGTPLLLMIDTAVCRPSWACQWPIPARLVSGPAQPVGGKER